MLYGLAHYYFYSMSLAITEYRENIAFNSIAIYSNTLDTLIYMIRICNLDIICSTTELTCSIQTIPSSRNRWIDLKTIEVC